MGIETVVIASLIATTLSSVVGGIQQKKQTKSEARVIEANAMRQASLREEQAERVKKIQKLKFLKSGVDLEGSPLLLLEETTRIGREEAAQIRAGGMTQASQLRRRGRSAVIGGMLGAGAGAFDILRTSQQIGGTE